MKFNFKKTLSFVLASVVAISTFTGCEKKEEVNSENEVSTLLWYVPGNKQADIESVLEEANKIIGEKINAKLDLQFVDNGAYSEKMTMAMASGTPYDLAFVGYNNNYRTATSKGGLYPIKEWVFASEELKNSMPQYAWDDVTYQGEIYAVPNVQIFAQAACAYFRKDLVEKYNFDVSTVKKTEDIEPFLEIIKKNEPDMYPIAAGNLVFRDYESDLKVDPLVSGVKAVEQPDGSVKAVKATEVTTTKEMAEKKYDWYKKGYIRKDVGSVIDDSQDKKAGKYAVSLAPTYKPGGEEEEKALYGYDVVSVLLEKPYVSLDKAKLTMIGIGKDSKNPEKSFELIKLMNLDKKLYNTISFGVEGKHYNKTGENRIELIENSGYAPNSAWMFGNQFNAYLLPGQGENDWIETEEMNNTDNVSSIIGFIPDTTAIRAEMTQIESVEAEYKTYLKGNKDPAEYFDSYKKELEDGGIQIMIDELQKQIDEFVASKKK